MRIAVFHPSLVSRGGSQRYAIETVRHLIRRGHKAKLFTAKYSPANCYPELVKDISVCSLYTSDHVTSHKNLLRAHWPWLYQALFASGVYVLIRFIKNCLLSRRVYSLIRQQEKEAGVTYDVLYLHEVGAVNRFAKRFSARGCKSFLFCYDTQDKFITWEIEGIRYPKIHTVISRMLSCFDVATVRRYIQKVFVLDGVMNSKAKECYGIQPAIIHGGVDLSVFHPESSCFLQNRYGLSPESLIISNVSRFVPYRRIHDIFEAFVLLPMEVRSQIYVYVNAIDEDKVYFQKIMSQYAKHIYPQGRIIIDKQFPSSDTELASIYQSSSLFVFPNEWQTWGNAVLEAMACGRCVLVSDSCGIAEIIKQEENGLVYHCGDVGAMAKDIADLILNKKKRSRIGMSAAQHISAHFSWDVWTDKHLEYFNQSIAVDALPIK